jgi:hypothetical protein
LGRQDRKRLVAGEKGFGRNSVIVAFHESARLHSSPDAMRVRDGQSTFCSDSYETNGGIVRHNLPKAMQRAVWDCTTPINSEKA